jgi:hypothetical protein
LRSPASNGTCSMSLTSIRLSSIACMSRHTPTTLRLTLM